MPSEAGGWEDGERGAAGLVLRCLRSTRSLVLVCGKQQRLEPAMVPRGAGRNGKQEGASSFLLQLCSPPLFRGQREKGAHRAPLRDKAKCRQRAGSPDSSLIPMG